jgi:hypothetical protein
VARRGRPAAARAAVLYDWEAIADQYAHLLRAAAGDTAGAAAEETAGIG